MMQHRDRDRADPHSRQLRQSMTDAEQFVWRILRGRRFASLKFRRQHRINQFIADFYCPRLKLVIELDGNPHFDEAGLAYDAMRTAELEKLGIRVVRLENYAVIENPKVLIEAIAKYVSE